ncbi:hypothetical protein, partial [Actinotalea sp.]|uniref:hypothetical protein n=1 Tax=Actinotalea sp. TaxID=1872145 RepID=UPI0035677484
MTPRDCFLYAVLVTYLIGSATGTIVGPMIRGSFGYEWGYFSGIYGPLSILGLIVVTAVAARR